ncbi:hypothetical protein V2H45_24330 [Tumidithrix elongata RA019]|uniref:Protein kinase domain-containing protein n=1 Tax=Tumidithrix elongata BACA0141 TaxID=2716417 RepID=A0AAW9Q9J6_9CYAN|nr:hypothetical protein [Tumidithrix elongata RA019]
MQNLPHYSTYRSLLAKKQGKGFSEAEVQEILCQVLAQLASLHDRNQVHGSISLDTVVYDRDQKQTVLLDGTGTNHRSYLAPEILQTGQATLAADIYALGVVAIVLLTGLPPESLKAPNDTWNWRDRCTASDRFAQILHIALFAAPTFRYVNAGRMLQSLQPIMATSPLTIATPAIASPPTIHNEFIPPLPPLPPKISAEDLREELILDLEETFNLESDRRDLGKSQEPDKNHQTIPDLTGYKKKKSAKGKFTANTKAKTRILLVILLGLGVPAVALVGGYCLIQSKFSTATPSKDLLPINAIVPISISTLERTRIYIDEIEKAEKKMDKLLALAQDKYKNTGNLTEVKTMLLAVPSNSRIRPKADKLLSQWQQDAKKNGALIEKAEKAVNEGNWQVAIDTIKGISSTPYWQKRGSKIAEIAKQRLASSIAPPLSPIQVAPPPAVPLEPEVVPFQAPIPQDPIPSVQEPPSYYQPSPPERSYPETYSAPAPPPPRVAQ